MTSNLAIEPACIDDLPGIVACDDLAQSDPNRLRSLEAWVKWGECFVARCNASLAGVRHSGMRFLCQGLGLQLLAAAESECQTEKLFTTTNAANSAARSLFERAGFVPSGTIENLDADDPEWVYLKRLAIG